MSRRFSILGLALLAACASGARSDEAPATEAEPAYGGEAEADEAVAADEPMAMDVEPEEESMQLMVELGDEADAFDSALQLADCDAAFGHRDAICDLADRICVIAQDEADVAQHCEDAEERCASARERVSDACD